MKRSVSTVFRGHSAASGKRRYKFLVSACLAGIPCTYKGNHKKIRAIAEIAMKGYALAICPEVIAGLGVPRRRSEIVMGDGLSVLNGAARVITDTGKDVTGKYIKASYLICRLAKKHGIGVAILRSKSPACGSGYIYDGTFTGKLRKGPGVLAAALKKTGVVVWNERQRLEILEKARCGMVQ